MLVLFKRSTYRVHLTILYGCRVVVVRENHLVPLYVSTMSD